MQRPQPAPEHVKGASRRFHRLTDFCFLGDHIEAPDLGREHHRTGEDTQQRLSGPQEGQHGSDRLVFFCRSTTESLCVCFSSCTENSFRGSSEEVLRTCTVPHSIIEDTT